jgi:sugar (pentulose or hexulose) kinase
MRSGPRTCHLGIDVGTTSVRAAAFDAEDGELVSEAMESLAPFRSRGRHELDFEETWNAIERVLARLDPASSHRASPRGDAAGPEPAVLFRIASVAVATTASTIVALDDQLRPVDRGWLWADHRAFAEAEAIRRTGHPVLARMLGQVSPEWGLPKLIHLWKTKAPSSPRRGPSSTPRIRHVVELLDWVNLRLTGRLVANVGIREWGWCVGEDREWPPDFVDGLDLDGPLALVPRESLPTGSHLGPVRAEVADRYPMLRNATVAMGGMDSYMAALGQGVVEAGRLALSVGSSSSIVARADMGDARGHLFGPMRGIVPGIGDGYWHGGQSTAGLAIDWIRQLIGGDAAALEAAAARIAPGSEGLAFRETLLDRRTPAPQPGLRGMWYGLTLSHTAAHLYRSVLEGVAFGARYAAGPLRPSEIVATGGLTESRLFLSLLASAFGQRVGLLRHARSAAFGAAFAGDASRAATLNPIVEWVEAEGPALAPVMNRYLALHRLPLSVSAAPAH